MVFEMAILVSQIYVIARQDYGVRLDCLIAVTALLKLALVADEIPLSGNEMKSGVTWLLMLLTIHAPVPCPDLDGECRGTPIESLAEMQAWHVLLLGIRPSDDIDRGPIRPSDEESPLSPDETPFGKLVVVSGSVSSSTSMAQAVDVEPMDWNHLSPLAVDLSLSSGAAVWRFSDIPDSSCRRLARLCVWRV